jgi:methionine biosynthesis protein MetW
LSTEGVQACVSAGLSVIQGDADTDLEAYPDGAFDYVVLSQTLQTVTSPRIVLEHMLRIGKRAIVSFPNFAYWRLRLHLALHGQMPVSDSLPYHWYDTPNIHLCTIKDFLDLCSELGVTVERSVALDREGQVRRVRSNLFLANLLGVQAVFVLKT